MKKLLVFISFLLFPLSAFAAGYFPSGSNILQAPDAPELDGSATMSWCAAYYLDFTSLTTAFGIMDKRTSFTSQNSWSMGNAYGGLMGTNFGIVVSSAGNNEGGAAAVTLNVGTTPIKLKTWQHVCYTFNGNRTNDNWRVYINAVPQALAVNTNLNAAIFNSTTGVGIACVNACSFLNTNAPIKLHDLRIYNRELSAGEVRLIYQGLPITSGLVAQWLVTRTIGTEPDISPYHHNATITGTVPKVGSPPFVGRYRR